MHTFRDLWARVRAASVEQLPPEIYASLVDSLYAPFGSFTVGAVVPPLIGGIAAWRTGSAWLMALSAAAAVIAALRVFGMFQYRARKPSIGIDVAEIRRWELAYEISAALYSTCIGAMCFVVFFFSEDAASQLMVNAVAFAYTAGATARNLARPRIATSQLSLILLPVAAACLLRNDSAYAILSVITVLYYFAALEILKFLSANRLRLLRTTQDKGELTQSLTEQNFLFETALNNMAQGLCMFDPQQRLLIANRRFSEIFGITSEKLAPGTPIGQVMALAQAVDENPDAAAAAQRQLLSEIPTGPVVTTLADGRIISISHRPMPNGGLVATFDDVTEQRAAEARANFLATHDHLTGLPNRVVLSRAVNDAVAAGRRGGREFAVMFIDLDRFKLINDTLGHGAGDTLLIEIGERLKHCVRDSDLVTRIGGDEFIVLLHDAATAGRASVVARKILAAVVKPLTVHGQECRVTASIGISLFPSDAEDEETLTKNADVAMYAAKEDGRNRFVFHSRAMQTQSIERLMLETSLRRALERHEFVLHYQPKYDLRRGSISGVEALVRWQHPDLGLLPPNRFISVAEETGLIVPIGKWVLETACAQNMAWQRQNLPPIRMAVNLSPRQFADPKLLSDIRAALDKSGMSPQLLELEITESMVVQDLERTVQVLESIKRLGITLSIDDFGTGYSSMALVKKLPIDVLKIDRSFVREIANDADDKAIADAIIALGRALNLTIVAEGVETAEQEAVLRAHNCDEIQGYLISKPIPADEFGEFLANRGIADLKALAAANTPTAEVLSTGTQG
jgi:diguanylate cyclase (GGDEF)-like protein